EQIALRQRLRLSAQPLAARAARPPRDPASLYQAAPAADQRQGRTIPTNPQTRVGTRSDLPLLRPPRPGTVTLAQLLQRAQTAQLTRRTPTHQPRPQRPEAGHLDAMPTSPERQINFAE